ncbi:hypothetical protein [Massilia violaceinigra]|nr:hypothetical protein [Massilia violaceinigra]
MNHREKMARQSPAAALDERQDQVRTVKITAILLTFHNSRPGKPAGR